MALQKIRSHGSFRRQIILTFVVGFFLLISAFSTYLVLTERDNLRRDSLNETTNMAQVLAASARPWVEGKDRAGLRDAMQAFSGYPELSYAMIISPEGRVLAHSDPSKVGTLLTDEPTLSLLKSPPAPRLMEDSRDIVAMAVPITIDGHLAGWSKVASLKKENSAYLRSMILNSALFLLIATALSLLAAMVIADRLGQRIGTLVGVAEAVQAGNYSTRIGAPEGEDEIARLGNSLNTMLEALAQNERDLRFASLYTRSLLEASLDPLVTISPEGKITDVNAATEKATGMNRNQLIGTDFADYFTEPDKARAGYQQVFAQGSITDYPLALRHRDGHITDVLYNASVYRSGAGKVLGVFAAARDVTERNKAEASVRESEALLQATMKILPVGMWVLDAKGQIIFGNDAARKIWGGMHYVDIEHLGEYRGWWADTGKQVGPHDWSGSRAVEEGEIATDEEIEIECFDGTHKFILDSAVPLRNDDGSIRGAVTINQDITERKKLELQLRRSFAYTRSLIEASLDPLVTISAEGKITDVNRATETATGLDRTKLIGTDFSDYFTEPEHARAGYRTVFEKGFVTDYPLTLRHRDGHLSEVLYNANVYRDEAGKVLGAFAAARDITERKKAEEALFAAQQIFRSLVENSPDVITRYDRDCRRTYVNPSYLKITATPREEWIGTAPIQHSPLPPASAKTIQNLLHRVLDSGVASSADVAWPMSDNVEHWFNVYAFPEFDREGRVISVMTISRDFTERKKAELEREQYFKFFNVSTDLMGIADPNGAFKKINPAFTELLGYSEDEILAKPFIEFVHPDDRQSTLDEMERQLKIGYTLDFENRYLCKDGSVKWVSWRAYANNEEGLTYAAGRDITERKKAEHELAQLSLRNRLILDSAGEGIYGLDIEGNCTFVNPAAAQLLGFSIEELIGLNTHALFHHSKPDGTPYPAEECPVQMAFKQGLARRGVDLYWRKDGSNFPVEFSSTPIMEGGTVTGAVVTFSDITERKKTEDALAESEKEFHLLAEAMPQIVWVTRPDGWNIYFNQQWVDYTGLTLEESYGHGWNKPFHPDDQQRAWDAWQNAVNNLGIYSIESRLRRHDGNYRWWLVRGVPVFDEHGKIAKWFGTCTDIDDIKTAEEKLRESEERLRLEFSRMPIGYIIWDPQFRVASWNPAAEKIFGYTFEEAIGHHPYEIIVPAQAQPQVEDVWHRLLAGDATAHSVNENITKDGRTIICEWTNTPLKDADGTIHGAMAMVQDITERQQAEEEVRRLNAELEQRVQQRTAQLEAANKELEAFSYSVSHDLRSPLRAIDGFSNILLEDYAGKLDDEGKRLVGVVRENTIRMARLIDDILAFSRLGRKEMSRLEVDMTALAQEAANELAPTLAGREVNLEIGELPAARGDSAMLRQVWVNLLSNALKFTRKTAAARVDVSGRVEGSEVVYCVKDNGAGFDMQYADKLFGVFQRLHSAEEFEGTGAGLAIVKRIVVRHGGRVWGEGKVNEGAAFYFALPAKEDSDAEV